MQKDITYCMDGQRSAIFGDPWWRAGVFKAFFFLLQLLWLLSPEDLMFWSQSILWQNAKDTEMLTSMAGPSRRHTLLSFRFHSTIYTNWYRWLIHWTDQRRGKSAKQVVKAQEIAFFLITSSSLPQLPPHHGFLTTQHRTGMGASGAQAF